MVFVDFYTLVLNGLCCELIDSDVKNHGQNKTCMNVRVEVDFQVSWRGLEGLKTSQNRSRLSQKSIRKVSAKLFSF